MTRPANQPEGQWARPSAQHFNAYPPQPPVVPPNRQPSQFPPVNPAYYNQAPMNPNTYQTAPEQPNGKKERKYGWPAKVAAAAGVIALGVGIKYGAHLLTGEGKHETASGTSTSAEPFQGSSHESMPKSHVTKDELLAIDDQNQAAAAAESASPADLVQAFSSDFDKWRQETLDGIKKNNMLNDEQLKVFSVPDPSIPKDQWDDQMIWNGLQIDKADATSQDPAKLGYLMLPEVESTNAGGYTADRSFIGTGHYSLNVYQAGQPERKLTKDTFMGIPINPKTAKVMFGTLVRNDQYNNPKQPSEVWRLVDLQTGSDGQTQQWRELGEWPAYGDSDIDVQQEIARQ